MKLRRVLDKPLRLLSASWEQGIQGYFARNRAYIVLFCALFAINVLIYGQKLVGDILATDDFSRFFLGSNLQANWNGRWFNGFIGKYVLTKELHILPYFNTVIGVFSFTLAGFLTALLFGQKKPLRIAVVTLLCSTSPYVTHNFFFNTNAIAWITTAWGVLGFYWFCKRKTLFRGVVFFILLVFAIGTFQTIVQIMLVIVVMRAMQSILCGRSQREIFQAFIALLFHVAVIGFAFVASSLINTLVIHLNDLDVWGRYAISMKRTSLMEYFMRIINMYKSFKNNDYLLWYNSEYFLFLFGVLFMGIYAIVLAAIEDKKLIRVKLISVVVFLALIPLIKELPLIKGVGTPTRAYYTIAWLSAGLFTLSYAPLRKQSIFGSMLRNSSLSYCGRYSRY